jgi:sodium/hydrogen antiporter
VTEPEPAATIAAVDVVYVVVGLGVLLAAALPRLLRRVPLSPALPFVAVGLGVGLLPVPIPAVDPVGDAGITLRLAEVTVIVALMGVGLAIDRPLGWRSWLATWRLLLLAMPLCIGAVALLGWGLMGLAPAAAVLLGAALAPTDPVLASEVQVGAPTDDPDSEDDVRVAITTEAGLNDGLAFPFVYLAIFLTGAGVSGGVLDWGPRWLAWEVVGKIVVGAALGAVVGWALARTSFAAPRPGFRFADAGESVVALGATFLAYGMTEAAGGYGFIAVFVAAVVIRAHERGHEYHRVLHEFVEQIERILTLVLLLLLGVACTTGLLAELTWQGVAIGILLVLVVRPLAAWISLPRVPGLDRRERAAVSFFGVRGIGSFYYLAYAAEEGDFGDIGPVWSAIAFTVLLSVVVHGVTATPVMARLDREREDANK